MVGWAVEKRGHGSHAGYQPCRSAPRSQVLSIGWANPGRYEPPARSAPGLVAYRRRAAWRMPAATRSGTAVERCSTRPAPAADAHRSGAQRCRRLRAIGAQRQGSRHRSGAALAETRPEPLAQGRPARSLAFVSQFLKESIGITHDGVEGEEPIPVALGLRRLQRGDERVPLGLGALQQAQAGTNNLVQVPVAPVGDGLIGKTLQLGGQRHIVHDRHHSGGRAAGEGKPARAAGATSPTICHRGAAMLRGVGDRGR